MSTEDQNPAPSATPFPAPAPSQAFFSVSVLEAGFLEIPIWEIIAGVSIDDPDVLHVPSLAFFLRHSKTGKHLLFDLGIRRNCEKDDPGVTVRQTSNEALRKGGVNPEEIETVILSHLHWDHVGQASEFPNAKFILGPGCKHLVEEDHPEQYILPASVPPSRAHILDASTDFPLTIGPFPQAHDFFGDGSLYIINAEGHLPGHINVLARTSADGSWILLAADSVHDLRILTGEAEIAHVHDKLGHLICAHDFKELAIEHIKRVRSLLTVPKVHVLIAHDWEWFEKNKDAGVLLPGTIPPKLD